jgi:hypothetical protein
LSGERISKSADEIRQRARDLAGHLSADARGSASIAQERAILRMLGVDGLDRAGRPLASSVSDRYCGSDRSRLASGVLLPLVVAMLEYDLPPRATALEVASGAIDLGLEGELLARPDRLLPAEQRAIAVLEAAAARIDANRTATREMREVLGSPPEPHLGATVRSSEVESAEAEIGSLVAQGAGVVEVKVPASWELTEVKRLAAFDTGRSRGVGRGQGGAAVAAGSGRAGEAMRSAPAGRPRLIRGREREAAQSSSMSFGSPVPAGSQRGLAELRRATDDASAERGCYASLMTVTSAFAAPEQAVVAAFERIDYVEADPIREIVEDNVDPERALADHSFAHRVEARAGSRLLLGAGPLALGAEVAAGVPSDVAARAGRALALQALGVELSLADGLVTQRILLGCIPSWIVGGGDAAGVFLQVLVRRIVFPDHPLVVTGPVAGLTTPAAAAVLSTALTAGGISLVLDRGVRDVSAGAADLAAIAAGAAGLRSALAGGNAATHWLRGEAEALAGRILDEAALTLEKLASDGWASLLGPTGSGERDRLGRSAVVDRASGPGCSAALVDRFF